MPDMDYKLLENPRIAKQALETILQTKQGLDDLVDTLELLSDPRFKKKLEQGLKELRQGRVVRLTAKELRKRLKWVMNLSSLQLSWNLQRDWTSRSGSAFWRRLRKFSRIREKVLNSYLLSVSVSNGG
jgi:hypothetical protein